MDDLYAYGVAFRRRIQFSEFFEQERPQSYGQPIQVPRVRQRIDHVVQGILTLNFQGAYIDDANVLEDNIDEFAVPFCQALERASRDTS